MIQFKKPIFITMLHSNYMQLTFQQETSILYMNTDELASQHWAYSCYFRNAET